VRTRALAHPDQSVSRLAIAVGSYAVIANPQFERVLTPVEIDHGRGGSRVLPHIRQRLLKDPVCSEVDALRERLGIAFDPQFDIQPACTRAFEQIWQLLQPGQRRTLRALISFAQHSEQAAHLAK
jgi:hypothetical protein